VASLRRLVASPALEPLLAYVSRPRTDPVVERVALIEDLAQLRDSAQHALVLLTRSASVAASSYRFDVALREARSRGVAALVLTARDVAHVTPTAAAIADRSGMALLGTGDTVDLAVLATAIAREIAGDAEVALLRAHTTLRAIDAHPATGDADGLLRFWDPATGAKLWTLPVHKSAVIGVHLEGTDIVTRGFTGEISRWQLPRSEAMIAACARHSPCGIVP